MQGIKLDAVRGPVSLDDRLTAVNNIYIKKVEKKKMFGYDKEELWNTVIKTYPNVSQFWTYDKEAFLKQPVYSRDFPPCKFCDSAEAASAEKRNPGLRPGFLSFAADLRCARAPESRARPLRRPATVRTSRSSASRTGTAWSGLEFVAVRSCARSNAVGMEHVCQAIDAQSLCRYRRSRQCR